ncbi:Phage tail fibers, partial [hydrothermal vent metagenome]
GIDQHFLNVQVDIGSGFVDMGTTEFMAVPYAKQADTATNATNTTSANNGLTIDGNTVIDNGGGWHRSYGATGWYNNTYGGGIYMTDTQWIRIFGNKGFLIPNGDFQVDSSNGTFKVVNGNVGIATSNPTVKLQINGTTDAALSNGSGLFVTGNETGLNIVFDDNEIMARNNGSISPLYLQNDGGNLIINNANNGNVGIGTSVPSSKLDVNGVIRAQNNNWPTTGAGIEIAYDPNFVAGVLPSFKFGAGYIQSYRRDLSEFRPLFLGATNVLPVNDNSFGLGNTTFRWLQVYAVNGTIQTSDRRMKKEINNITYGLNTVMKLRPVSYKWKKGNQDLNLGLIAQEVQKLIPEVIDVGDDKDKILGMKYTELIPVLIKAIQEQQKIIEQQKNKNQQLSAELTTQNKNLEKRIDALEAKNQ